MYMIILCNTLVIVVTCGTIYGLWLAGAGLYSFFALLSLLGLTSFTRRVTK